LINVALEKLVEGSFELPGYSTLDEMAARIDGVRATHGALPSPSTVIHTSRRYLDK
jgi:hypothetical protein